MNRGRSRRAETSATIVLATVALATTLLVPSPARAQSAEDAVVVDPDGLPMTGGSGDTPFSLHLPDGAACPGDSQDGQYRVQSFLVPVTADPATLRYQGLHPETDDGWALYEVNTNTYMNRPTAVATEPGGEGAIINIPSFSFAVFEPGMLPLGRMRIGLACSLFAETERHWEAQIEIVADEDDLAGISWTVVDPPAGAGEGGSSTSVLGGVALAALAGVGATLLIRRRGASGDRRVSAAR